jgi:hypothetical protein
MKTLIATQAFLCLFAASAFATGAPLICSSIDGHRSTIKIDGNKFRFVNRAGTAYPTAYALEGSAKQISDTQFELAATEYFALQPFSDEVMLGPDAVTASGVLTVPVGPWNDTLEADDFFVSGSFNCYTPF